MQSITADMTAMVSLLFGDTVRIVRNNQITKHTDILLQDIHSKAFVGSVWDERDSGGVVRTHVMSDYLQPTIKQALDGEVTYTLNHRPIGFQFVPGVFYEAILCSL
jgi:hypothetical protein